MTILITPEDRVPAQIGDMTFYFSPITKADAAQMRESLIKFQGASQEDILKNSTEMLNVSMNIVKKTLKKIEGLKKADGSDFKLEFDDNGMVSDSSMDKLMYLDMNTLERVFTVAGKVIGGQTKEGAVLDNAGNPIEGVFLKKTIPGN